MCDRAGAQLRKEPYTLLSRGMRGLQDSGLALTARARRVHFLGKSGKLRTQQQALYRM